jgi:hypothetical protein
MAGTEKPDDAEAGTPSTDEALVAAWAAFRACDVAYCPRDRGPMALCVDGAAAAYRFVCVPCGFASSWFESGPQGMKMRGLGPVSEPSAPPSSDE